MKFPKFSICIPNYNYGCFIGQTIRSILNQDYSNFEIIVADNASTDDSVEVIQSFGDSRIRLVQNTTNIGFAPNLDKATEQATGDYMIVISSDDIMKQGALKIYAQIIQDLDEGKNDLVITSDVDVIDEKATIIGNKKGINEKANIWINHQSTLSIIYPKQYRIFQGIDLLRYTFQGSFTNIGQFLSTCYSRKLFEEVEGYRSIMTVVPDAHFSYKLMSQNPRVIHVQDALFQYRVHKRGNFIQTHHNIKIYCDNYVLIESFEDVNLRKLGMTRNQVRKNFIRSWCLEKPFWRLLTGKVKIAYRPYFFGLSAYPNLILREPLFWLNLIIALFYPAIYLTYTFYKLIRKHSILPLKSFKNFNKFR